MNNNFMLTPPFYRKKTENPVVLECKKCNKTHRNYLKCRETSYLIPLERCNDCSSIGKSLFDYVDFDADEKVI